MAINDKFKTLSIVATLFKLFGYLFLIIGAFVGALEGIEYFKYLTIEGATWNWQATDIARIVSFVILFSTGIAIVIISEIALVLSQIEMNTR